MLRLRSKDTSIFLAGHGWRFWGLTYHTFLFGDRLSHAILIRTAGKAGTVQGWKRCRFITNPQVSSDFVIKVVVAKGQHKWKVLHSQRDMLIFKRERSRYFRLDLGWLTDHHRLHLVVVEFDHLCESILERLLLCFRKRILPAQLRLLLRPHDIRIEDLDLGCHLDRFHEHGVFLNSCRCLAEVAFIILRRCVQLHRKIWQRLIGAHRRRRPGGNSFEEILGIDQSNILHLSISLLLGYQAGQLES